VFPVFTGEETSGVRVEVAAGALVAGVVAAGAGAGAGV